MNRMAMKFVASSLLSFSIACGDGSDATDPSNADNVESPADSTAADPTLAYHHYGSSVWSKFPFGNHVSDAGVQVKDAGSTSVAPTPVVDAGNTTSTGSSTSVVDAGSTTSTGSSTSVVDAGSTTSTGSSTSVATKDASVSAPGDSGTTTVHADAGVASDAGSTSTGTTGSTHDAGTSTGTTATSSMTSAPLGGPGNYTKLIMNDVFGANRAGANVTSTSTFNPSTSYGAQGTGWDTWMKFWNPTGTHANVAMRDTYLELDPTNGAAGFIVSHLELLPTASVSYYIEVKAATGLGAYGNGSSSWPAIWLYAGNESNANDQQSEIDIMETYADLAWGSTANAAGQYTQYFTTTIHSTPNHAVVGGPYATVAKGIDLTATMNVYGCELTLVNGKVNWKVYLNGALVQSSTTGIAWTSSAPALIIGWNPGSSPYAQAAFKLDSVKVWTK